jgi:uncharacterized protein YecE (DUF72 family)
MFASDYTDKELSEEAARIRRYRREKLDVYVYFNNDASGYAIKNARSLSALTAEKGAASGSVPVIKRETRKPGRAVR